MGNNDYGYFGTGSTGYAHYTQAHSRSFSGSKPTSSGGKYTPDTTDPWEKFKTNTLYTILFWSPIFVILTGLNLIMMTLCYFDGIITTVEFTNELSIYLVWFIASVAFTIYTWRIMLFGKK